MFNSYEPGRAGYVTLIANYLPLQDAYGGPNYFKLDPNALYEIHIDNNGDGKEDITFQFRFKNTLKGKTLDRSAAPDVAIPLTQFGPGDGAATRATLNVNETFTVDVVRGDRRTGTARPITNAAGGSNDVRQAGRQHRHQDDSRLRRLRGAAHLQRQHPRLHRRRARSSSASARTRSRSTSA